MFSELAQRERPVDYVIGRSDFLRLRHLAFDAPDGFGAGEPVSLFQSGDLGFAVGGDDDGCIHSLVDAGLEQQGHIVDDDGLGVVPGGFTGETLLFPCHPGMDNPLKRQTFSRMAKDDRAECAAVDRAVGVEHTLAERFDYLLPGRLALFYNHTGQGIGVDDDGTMLLEHCGYSALSGSHAASESHKDHGRGAYMRRKAQVEVEVERRSNLFRLNLNIQGAGDRFQHPAESHGLGLPVDRLTLSPVIPWICGLWFSSYRFLWRSAAQLGPELLRPRFLAPSPSR